MIGVLVFIAPVGELVGEPWEAVGDPGVPGVVVPPVGVVGTALGVVAAPVGVVGTALGVVAAPVGVVGAPVGVWEPAVGEPPVAVGLPPIPPVGVVGAPVGVMLCAVVVAGTDVLVCITVAVGVADGVAEAVASATMTEASATVVTEIHDPAPLERHTFSRVRGTVPIGVLGST
jgi:hypothetical protein